MGVGLCWWGVANLDSQPEDVLLDSGVAPKVAELCYFVLRECGYVYVISGWVEFMGEVISRVTCWVLWGESASSSQGFEECSLCVCDSEFEGVGERCASCCPPVFVDYREAGVVGLGDEWDGFQGYWVGSRCGVCWGVCLCWGWGGGSVGCGGVGVVW